MARSTLSLIILNYNSQFWLKKTLQTLKKFYLAKTKYAVSVTVVDNASTDDSLSMLKQQFKGVGVLALPENRGYAVGNNAALKKVTTTYAMLLNSDVEFTSESDFDLLIEWMDLHPEVAVITPKVQYTTGELDLAAHRGEPTLWASFTFFLGLEKLFPKSSWFGQYHQLYKDMDEIHEIDACSGAAMLVRTSAMKKVGLLDEQFFMYAEDLDWCKRFREAGYKIFYHPKPILIHHKYKSGLLSTSRQIVNKTRGHFYDTMLQYYDKHYATQYPKWVRTVVKYILEFKKGGL